MMWICREPSAFLNIHEEQQEERNTQTYVRPMVACSVAVPEIK